MSDRIYVERAPLPARVQSRIRDLAMFQNPEYFRKKNARISTWRTPRVVRCSEVTESHIVLPRGMEPALLDLTRKLGVHVNTIDQREGGQPIKTTFRGELTTLQRQALTAVSTHDTGVLVLPTGMGKTVVACALIARRATSTLVVVNRRPLLEQWRSQLAVFLDVDNGDVGQLGGGKVSATGSIDVATMQTLVRGNQDVLKGYGQIIVDECHHVAAATFERVLSRAPAKYLLGLTATPKRRDGHHPIMHMQLGPVRFEASAKLGASQRPFTHRYFVRSTELAETPLPEKLSALQTRLSEDARRNSFILDDAVAALRDGRSPLVLCQRREHVLLLADRLQRYAPHMFVLMGAMKARQCRDTFDALRDLPAAKQRLVIATGSFVGEGFDDARLDTLLLAAPISWKGTLAQYAGRLHRLHPDKREVWIFDYVDRNVPQLARMFERRRTGYRALGYSEGDPPHDFELMTDPDWDGWSDSEGTALEVPRRAGTR